MFSVRDNEFTIVTDADTRKQITQTLVGVEPDAAIYAVQRRLVFASNCEGTLTVVKRIHLAWFSGQQRLRGEKEP